MPKTSRPSSIDEIKAELKRPKKRKSRRRNKRRINTESIETALDQIIRANTSGAKASIKPEFVVRVLKELIDYRNEEKQLAAEVEEIYGDNADDYSIRIEDEPKLRAEEVMSLSELGNSSWESGSNLYKIEWKRQGVVKLPVEKPDDESAADQDDSNVIHEVRQRSSLRTNRKSSSGLRAARRWNDGSSTRRMIIFTLLIIILLICESWFV